MSKEYKPHIGGNVPGEEEAPQPVGRYADIDILRRDLETLFTEIDALEDLLEEDLSSYALLMDETDDKLVESHRAEWPSGLGEPAETVSYGYYKALGLVRRTTTSAYIRKRFEEAARDVTGTASLDLLPFVSIIRNEAILVREFLDVYTDQIDDSSEYRTIEIFQDWVQSALGYTREFWSFIQTREAATKKPIPPTELERLTQEEAAQGQAVFKLKLNELNNEIVQDTEYLKANFSDHAPTFYKNFLGPALQYRLDVGRKAVPTGSEINNEVEKASNTLDSNLRAVLSDQMRRRGLFHQRAAQIFDNIQERDRYREAIKELAPKGKAIPTTGPRVMVSTDGDARDWENLLQETPETFRPSHNALGHREEEDAHPQYLLKSGGDMVGDIELDDEVLIDGMRPATHRHTDEDGTLRILGSDILDIREDPVDEDDQPPIPYNLEVIMHQDKTVPPGYTVVDSAINFRGHPRYFYEVQITPLEAREIPGICIIYAVDGDPWWISGWFEPEPHTVHRLDPEDGETIWNMRIEDMPVYDDDVYAVKGASDGGLFVAGGVDTEEGDFIPSEERWVVDKLSSDGELLWRRRGLHDSLINGVASHPTDGGVYTSGIAEDSEFFRAYRLDAYGNVMWRFPEDINDPQWDWIWSDGGCAATEDGVYVVNSYSTDDPETGEPGGFTYLWAQGVWKISEDGEFEDWYFLGMDSEVGRIWAIAPNPIDGGFYVATNELLVRVSPDMQEMWRKDYTEDLGGRLTQYLDASDNAVYWSAWAHISGEPRTVVMKLSPFGGILWERYLASGSVDIDAIRDNLLVAVDDSEEGSEFMDGVSLWSGNTGETIWSKRLTGHSGRMLTASACDPVPLDDVSATVVILGYGVRAQGIDTLNRAGEGLGRRIADGAFDSAPWTWSSAADADLNVYTLFFSSIEVDDGWAIVTKAPKGGDIVEPWSQFRYGMEDWTHHDSIEGSDPGKLWIDESGVYWVMDKEIRDFYGHDSIYWLDFDGSIKDSWVIPQQPDIDVDPSHGIEVRDGILYYSVNATQSGGVHLGHEIWAFNLDTGSDMGTVFELWGEGDTAPEGGGFWDWSVHGDTNSIIIINHDEWSLDRYDLEDGSLLERYDFSVWGMERFVTVTPDGDVYMFIDWDIFEEDDWWVEYHPDTTRPNWDGYSSLIDLVSRAHIDDFSLCEHLYGWMWNSQTFEVVGPNKHSFYYAASEEGI